MKHVQRNVTRRETLPSSVCEVYDSYNLIGCVPCEDVTLFVDSVVRQPFMWGRALEFLHCLRFFIVQEIGAFRVMFDRYNHCNGHATCFPVQFFLRTEYRHEKVHSQQSWPFHEEEGGCSSHSQQPRSFRQGGFHDKEEPSA